MMVFLFGWGGGDSNYFKKYFAFKIFALVSGFSLAFGQWPARTRYFSFLHLKLLLLPLRAVLNLGWECTCDLKTCIFHLNLLYTCSSVYRFKKNGITFIVGWV